MQNYRIKRTDKRNITIQQKRGKEWRTISYHGNSVHSLVSGVFELVIAQHIPADEELLKQLKTLELEMIRGIERIEKMINDRN
jgi:hypothetical protein